MTAEDDSDCAAILARRRRFVALALSGLSGVGAGCRSAETEAPSEPPSPRCRQLIDELAGVRDSELLEETRAAGCYDVALSLVQSALTPSLERREQLDLLFEAHNIGTEAYRAGDHQAARAALTYFMDQLEVVFGPRDARRTSLYRSADRLLRDLDAGRPWEERRLPRPKPCLNMSKGGID